MKILVDSGEPGVILAALERRGRDVGFAVERTILHARPMGDAARARHPMHALGGDYVILEPGGSPVAAFERKTLEDLARTIGDPDSSRGGSRMFRQATELLGYPLPILLLEGEPSIYYRRLEAASLGFQFWCARQGLAIIHTTSPLASANAVFLVARKLAVEYMQDAKPSAPKAQGP